MTTIEAEAKALKEDLKQVVTKLASSLNDITKLDSEHAKVVESYEILQRNLTYNGLLTRLKKKDNINYMDINRKKEIAKGMKKKFLIQVEYEFDEDSQGFRRQVNLLEDSNVLASIEIINLLRGNFRILSKTIGKQIDDIIVEKMSEILDDKEMISMKGKHGSAFDNDGKFKYKLREDE